jgi:hypothetical protein
MVALSGPCSCQPPERLLLGFERVCTETFALRLQSCETHYRRFPWPTPCCSHRRGLFSILLGTACDEGVVMLQWRTD